MLTFEPQGRQGNQMFEIASTLGIGHKTSQFVFFPKMNLPFKYPFPFNDVKLKKYNVPWGYHDITAQDVCLRGYMQSYKYFEHIEDIIKRIFTFKAYPGQAYKEFISVHVRRGDYTADYYTLLGEDYYREALSMLPDLPVVVFTDDEYTASKIVPRIDEMRPAQLYPAADMALMTKAKYSIIANSSFSWWGAYLSEAEDIICPKSWFGPKSPFNTKDMIPENWTQI